MADILAIDVLLTWIAAAGCGMYLWMLYRAGRRGGGPQRFLIAVVACLLTVRGFDWLYGSPALERITLALAAVLPFAATLFVERILRRHHPLWFKLATLLVVLALLLASMLPSSWHDVRFHLAFACSSASIMFVNGLFLLVRRRASLSGGENALANALLLLAPIVAVLILTDFHQFGALVPFRLGSLAALLLVCSMLGTAMRNVGVGAWVWHYLTLLGVALMLAWVVAQALPDTVGTFDWGRVQGLWPVTFAWILLSSIVVRGRELAAERSSNDFMHWLAQAPLDNAAAFVEALKANPHAPTHILLHAADLRDHDVATLARLCDAADPIVSIARTRHAQRTDAGVLTDAAEQWVDLLERTEMTHGFIVARAPAQVLLFNVPASALPDRVESQLRVLSHICQQLDQRTVTRQGAT